MKLTSYTDYSIRLLIYLGVNDERLCTAQEISDFYDISRNHLSKIIHQLSKLKFIESYKGAAGGIKLATEPHKINLGALIRKTEPDFDIAECFSPERNSCKISPACKLKTILNESTKAFLKNLDDYSLADVLENKEKLNKIIQTASQN